MEETINKPSRIVTNYLDGLIINCDHSERGCTELLELGRLEAHSRTCNYKPVTCPNEKCAKIMNLADLEQHTSEVCEYRRVYCEECEKDITFRKYRKHGCVISKDVQAMKSSFIQVQDQVKKISETQKEMFEAIKNLTTTISAISTAEVPRSQTHDAKPQSNIVVVGGAIEAQDVVINCLNSVEMYSLANRTWSKLAPMRQKRASPTAHFYSGHVMVTGGHSDWTNFSSSIEYIQIHKTKYFSSERPSPKNRACPGEVSSFLSSLLIKCAGHKTVILNNYLWVVGGHWPRKQCSDAIYTMPINCPSLHRVNCPSLHRVKCRMPTPISYHGLELVHGNELFIMGGSTTGMVSDTVDTVLLYNTVTNTLRELHPLPFPMVDITTVKHGEDVIIIGGQKRDGEYLNTVFKYSWKKNKWEQLPGMKYKRSECAAVISGNKVFVMGGYNEEQGCLSLVECFDLDDQVWYELPFMNEAKDKIAAVLVP